MSLPIKSCRSSSNKSVEVCFEVLSSIFIFYQIWNENVICDRISPLPKKTFIGRQRHFFSSGNKRLSIILTHTVNYDKLNTVENVEIVSNSS